MPVLRQIAQLGHPVLRTPAVKVELPASSSIKSLIEDMVATLREANGVGIAAPQVYESQAIFIVASRPNARYPDAPVMEPLAVINLEIVAQSTELTKGWEGCLSIPGIRGEVPRHERIGVSFQAVDGERVERELSGFVARIFQHEFDHLNGLFFLDRVESPRDLISEQEYQRLVAART